MNQELVLVVIGVVVAAVVLRPLIRPGTGMPPGAPPSRGNADVPGTDELSELELDHAMGRISNADYERFLAETAEKTGSDAISAEMASDPVSNGENDAVARAERLVRQFREQPGSRCPKCGERPEPSARFCSNCGTFIRDHSELPKP